MNSSLRWLPALLLALLLLMACPALAEDVCVVNDASAATSVSTDRSYLRVSCPLDGTQNVTMTIRDAWGYLVYQRDYGMRSGSFRSEDVYLRLDGSSSTYAVTVQAGPATHQFRVTREAPRLTDSGVYAHGLPLSQLTGSRSNKFALIIDVDALEGSTLSVPLASGGMQLGFANITVSGGAVSVSAMLTVDGSIDKANVYVARDAVTAKTLGTSRFTGAKTRLNRSVDLYGTPYAAVMVQLTVSYDAATAQVLQQDDFFLDTQLALWDLMQLTTASEAVG